MISMADVDLDDPRTQHIDSFIESRLLTKRRVKTRRKSESNVYLRSTDSLISSSMDFRKLMSMIGTFYWLVLTAFIVPVACVSTLFVFIYPVMLFSLPLFNRLERALCRMVNDNWVSAGQYIGLTISEYGDDIIEFADKRCLCLANHLGLIDHFCLMTAFHDKKALPGKYLWVIFNIWKYTTLGFMWLAHGNFFINGGVLRRDRMLCDFRKHLSNNYWKHEYGWVVMYPEGSRLFLIRDSEVSFCQKNGFVPFRHCAHPRSGAAFAALNVCSNPTTDSKSLKKNKPLKKLQENGIEYVVDCTLGYPKGNVPNLGDALTCELSEENTSLAIHFRVHKVQPEWVNDELKLRDWLYEQYKIKDDLLENFYKTGRFPGKARPVKFSFLRNLMVQFIWIGLFFFHYNFWLHPIIKSVLKITWNLFFFLTKQ